MIVCQLYNVTKHHAANLVLEGVSLEVQHDARIGLVGPNGAGKSTLMRLVAGLDGPDGGLVTRRRGLRRGYLPQEVRFAPAATVLEAALEAREYLAEIETRRARLEERMADPAVYDDPDRLQGVLDEYEDALKEYEDAGGLNLEGRVLSNLKSLGFSEADHGLPVEALSGGQKKLLYLARVLATGPELLLLDEPDNHLDVAGKQMLERLIVDYEGAVVVVSHDRHLLDIVAESIAELEVAGQHPGREQLTVYPGNYSEYAFEKREALLRQQKDFELQQREVKRLELAAKRLMGWSGGQNEKFVRRARNIERRIERMDRIERPILEPTRMRVELGADRGGFKVLELKGVSKSFDGNEVLRGVDLLITHGERVALTGPNGAGKSVLFRVALGSETPTAGEVRVGARIVVGYYAQEHESLDPASTPADEVRRVKDMHEWQAYSFLGSFLFDAQKASRPVRTLSGGEKARLQVAKLVLQEPNLLLLDEPTNNLDILSCEVLEEAVERFQGTVFVISHDRYFLDRVATRVVELRNGRLVEVESGAAVQSR